MKYINLTQNQFAQVDDEDYDWLSQWKWCALKFNNVFYAGRTSYENGRYHKKQLFLHRVVMRVEDKITIVDHIDGNPLNNQKSNLRLATHSQNQQNRKISRNNTSGYLGVYFNSDVNKWYSQVNINKVHYYLGVWENKEDAARARDECIKQHNGYGRLNFPE